MSNHCTVGCAPECQACWLIKKPVGRSAPLAMANGLCDYECPGYTQEPTPCDLWPGEVREGKEQT